MVTELIEHIEVHHTEKIDGVKTQKLVIYYNCIGSIEIPDEVPIPEADITMKTRKGVEVTYVPAATAAPIASGKSAPMEPQLLFAIILCFSFLIPI